MGYIIHNFQEWGQENLTTYNINTNTAKYLLHNFIYLRK